MKAQNEQVESEQAARAAKERRDAISQQIGKTLEMLNGPIWPCERSRSCIDAEGARDAERAAKRSDGMRMGWHGYDPARMCPACAAAWHVACAYNFALGVRR